MANKSTTIWYWSSTIIIALMEGVMPLGTWIFAPEFMTFGTRALSYPDYFAYTLVIAKILGAIAITVPKTPLKVKEWAYAGFSFNFIFASVSHAVVDKNVGYVSMPLIFLGLLAISYLSHQKLTKLKTTEPTQ